MFYFLAIHHCYRQIHIMIEHHKTHRGHAFSPKNGGRFSQKRWAFFSQKVLAAFLRRRGAFFSQKVLADLVKTGGRFFFQKAVVVFCFGWETVIENFFPVFKPEFLLEFGRPLSKIHLNPNFCSSKNTVAVDGSEILHQLRLVVYPMIYRGF